MAKKIQGPPTPKPGPGGEDQPQFPGDGGGGGGVEPGPVGNLPPKKDPDTPKPPPKTPTTPTTPTPSKPQPPHSPKIISPTQPAQTGRRPGQKPPAPGPVPDLPPPSEPPPSDDPQPIAPTPEPKQGPHRTDTFVPSTEPLPVVYGATRVGAQIWYDKVQADGSRVVMYAVAHGEINSISSITIDGKAITYYGLVLGTTYSVFTGTAGQAISSIGTTAEPVLWTSAFPNIAYVIAKFPNPVTAALLPDVRRFLCDVQGRLVRDPRTDATLVNRYYRDNPALILADFMTSSVYGPGFADANMDWSGTITTAATACDFDIGAGTKRFTMAYVLSAKQDPASHIEAIRAHAAIMRPVYNAGKFQIIVDAAQASSGIAFTDVGAAANILSAGPLIVKGSSQVATRVYVKYVDPASDYKDSITPADDDPGLAGGTVELVERTYEMGTIPSDQAKRLAKYLRKRGGIDKMTTVRTNAEGAQVLPGMVIPITSAQLNWAAQLAIVTGVTSSRDAQNPSAWDLAVEVYDSAVYDDTKLTATASVPPASPSPYDTPPDVTAGTGAFYTTGTVGQFKRGVIYWTAPASYSYVKEYRVYDFRSGARTLFQRVRGGDAPTSTNPIDVSSICDVRNAGYNVSGALAGHTFSMDIYVTVVSSGGSESAGVRVTQSSVGAFSGSGVAPYVIQQETGIALANGLNSDITTPQGPGQGNITGPTAAFSIGGFTGPIAGAYISLVNNLNTLTIVNEDASSTAANRIKTLTGANIVLNFPSVVELKYSGTLSRWVVTSYRDPLVSANGATMQDGQASELLTIAAASTTDTSANLLPAGARIEAVTVRVVTAIPTATNFAVGDASAGTRFAASVAVAAGSTDLGIAHMDGTGITGPKQTTAAKVRISPNSIPAAATGVVRVTVFYRQFTAPTS